MSTNSSISIKEGNNIRTVYCHWDGYLSGVGQTLLDHYKRKSKIKNLINLGYLSNLGKYTKPKKHTRYRKYCHETSKETFTKCPHTFDTKHYDVTTAYHRDRGEELKILTMESKKLDSCLGEGFEYLYDADNDQWRVKTNYKGYWVKLTQRKINNEKY